MGQPSCPLNIGNTLNAPDNFARVYTGAFHWFNAYAFFFISYYIPPIVFQLQLQGNQSQEALQRALEHIHIHC